MTVPSVSGKGECEACAKFKKRVGDYTKGEDFVACGHHALLAEQSRQLAELQVALDEGIATVQGLLRDHGRCDCGHMHQAQDFLEQARRALESSRTEGKT